MNYERIKALIGLSVLIITYAATLVSTFALATIGIVWGLGIMGIV